MLTGLLGIRLVLLIGKTIPAPAPYGVMTALRHVQVTNDTKGGDGFQMTFSLSKGKTRDYSLLTGGALGFDTRVKIGVILGTRVEPLIDGIVDEHQISPGDEPGTSTLTVRGQSIIVMLDLEEKNEPYKNQSDSMIATQLIGRYGKFQVTPRVTPTTDVPIEIKSVTRQCGTDLEFLKALAERNGFVFYIEPQTMLTNKAHFGPEVRTGKPQHALNLNLGPSRNVNTLSFSDDALAPVEAKSSFLDSTTKRTVKIPALPSLRVPPLGVKPIKARRKILLRETANKNPARAAAASIAAATNTPDPAAATGDLNTERYGQVLRARQLVGVSGAGFGHDGAYVVQSITHEIERGKYTQSFRLTREGTGSLTPVLS